MGVGQLVRLKDANEADIVDFDNAHRIPHAHADA
jgi:hypothetical protein